MPVNSTGSKEYDIEQCWLAPLFQTSTSLPVLPLGYTLKKASDESLFPPNLAEYFAGNAASRLRRDSVLLAVPTHAALIGCCCLRTLFKPVSPRYFVSRLSSGCGVIIYLLILLCLRLVTDNHLFNSISLVICSLFFLAWWLI